MLEAPLTGRDSSRVENGKSDRDSQDSNDIVDTVFQTFEDKGDHTHRITSLLIDRWSVYVCDVLENSAVCGVPASRPTTDTQSHWRGGRRNRHDDDRWILFVDKHPDIRTVDLFPMEMLEVLVSTPV